MNTMNTNKENSTMNTTNTINNQNTATSAHLVFQDLPHVAHVKRSFPFCKSAKVGNLSYPVIANDNLMEFITFDENFVDAARKVKHDAFNPGGSEHGITKRACDMLIDNPSFRNVIRQDLIRGIYDPERITTAPVFVAKHMRLPRGYKNTVNKIVESLIMQYIKVSCMDECMMLGAWGGMNEPGISTMIERVDNIRAKGFKYWISLKLRNYLAKIPHGRLEQKIRIMFQDKRVAKLICTLLDLKASEADTHKGPKHVGIPKDSLLTDMLAYNLYLTEFDQGLRRLGLTHVRHNEEIIVFCDSLKSAEQAKDTISAFAKNTLECPVDQVRTRIKDIAHLAFHGLSLQGGRWRMQYSVKNAAASDYLVALMAYPKLMDDSLLWNAYRKLTNFISVYEGVYDLENEIQRLKEWRDDHFTGIIAFAEEVKMGIEKLPD